MKQSDIFSIILIATIGTFCSFLLCRAIMGDPAQSAVTFKTMRDKISASLENPDSEIFNSHAINPTVEVMVGDCTDIDQNGILDETELEQCAAEQQQQEEQQQQTENGEEGGETNEG